MHSQGGKLLAECAHSPPIIPHTFSVTPPTFVLTGVPRSALVSTESLLQIWAASVTRAAGGEGGRRGRGKMQNDFSTICSLLLRTPSGTHVEGTQEVVVAHTT